MFALRSFFKILEEQQVSRDDLDSKLLKLAEARDVQAIEEQEKTSRQRRVSAAESNVYLANLQRVQLRYAKAAEYWQKAAAWLPQESKQERARYLHEAGYDLNCIAHYSEALPLYEVSLSIRREVDDQALEGTTQNSIGRIYGVRGDYTTALEYLKESLNIRREIDDRRGEVITSWNIGWIYTKQRNLVKAEQHISRTVQLAEEIGHPKLEEYRKVLEGVRAEMRGR